jgi:L-alanine-DL-glutamate epimerase-like enolase superfamily enzyme
MESRKGIRVKTRIIPLPPVDWGDGDVRDVVLLEITSPEGITGLGSALCCGSR